MRTQTVVVGGGIAGILSSIILARADIPVTLIERSDKLGGLLSSFTNETGVSFDFGTHVPEQTGNDELDNILFSDITPDEWIIRNMLQPGNYFGDSLYTDSQLMYLPSLPKDVYVRGLVELLSTGFAPANHYNTAEEYLNDTYGQTYTDYIFRPLLMKLLGSDLVELHPYAHLLFGYGRLIPGGKHMSRELKKSAYLDKKLAYSSFREGVGETQKFYPRSGGIEKWIELLTMQAISAGVNIRYNTTISALHTQDNSKITRVECTDGSQFECEQLVWTLAPVILARLLNISPPSIPLKFRDMIIHHMIFDRPFDISNYYIYCNDPSFVSFRITLYPNLQQRSEQGPFNCTIEVLGKYDEEPSTQREKVVDELHQMGIVSKGSKLLYEESIKIENGFPVNTVEMVKGNHNIINQLANRYTNVSLQGRASGDAFFMSQVLVNTYHKTSNLVKTYVAM